MSTANKKGSTPKSTSKVAKAEKASFDKVISALEKEKEAFVTPRQHSKIVHFELEGISNLINNVQ